MRLKEKQLLLGSLEFIKGYVDCIDFEAIEEAKHNKKMALHALPTLRLVKIDIKKIALMVYNLRMKKAEEEYQKARKVKMMFAGFAVGLVAANIIARIVKR